VFLVRAQIADPFYIGDFMCDTNTKIEKETLNKDPWKHRSSGMKCKTCLWFVPKNAECETVPPDDYRVGRCRRHAPSINGYPVVYLKDWCGDHRIDENKI